ncbi:anhydro-N-acetylmuramic acid kinase [Erysipelothrix sp. D19-032]
MPHHTIDEVILGGGGAYNPLLVSLIDEMLDGVKVITQESLGFSSDAKEAIAFVILGNETLNKQPSNVPTKNWSIKASHFRTDSTKTILSATTALF